MADSKISDLTEATSVGGTEYVEMVQSGVNKKVPTSLLGVTREFNRTFVEALVFDKNEIFHAPFTQTGTINLTIGLGGLVDSASVMRFRMTADGIHAVNFGTGFDFLYGISNGQILDAGTYEFYFLYTNGSVTVNVPGVTSQQSSATTLATPSNFAAVSDGEEAIDLSWDDVSNESSYLIEVSTTGTGGWSTLSTPAANATASTQTGLTAGDTRYYRMKAIGDGVNFLDSAFTSVISAQTESGGDVTAPTFTFLPASGNTVWPVNKVITITANEPIRNTDGSAINDNDPGIIVLKETNSGGANISHSWTIDATKTIITITPTTQYGEVQLVFVSINNVEDVNGNEVTVAISSTFTTTDYTLFDGSAHWLKFGDILDSLFAAIDTNFWLEITLNNALLTGTRRFITKNDSPANQRSFSFYQTNSDVYFSWFRTGSNTAPRVVKWANALSAGEHILVLKYDGSIDTNDGLDRVTLLVDGGTAGSKTLDLSGSTLGAIFSSTAQLALAADINAAGSSTSSSYLSSEAKDFIVRSTAGSVVEINVPNLRTGTDTSGNGRNGTWV